MKFINQFSLSTIKIVRHQKIYIYSFTDSQGRPGKTGGNTLTLTTIKRLPKKTKSPETCVFEAKCTIPSQE